MKATFNHPAVVLDQRDHIASIKCSRYSIEVCFKAPEARETAQKSWIENTHFGSFYLLTYHLGCGDRTGQTRSYFRASQPVRNTGSDCVSVPVAPIEEHEALDSGDISWGTYKSPEKRKRASSAEHQAADADPQDAPGDAPGDTP